MYDEINYMYNQFVYSELLKIKCINSFRIRQVKPLNTLKRRLKPGSPIAGSDLSTFLCVQRSRIKEGSCA